MIKKFILLFFALQTVFTFSQIKKKDLIADWYAENETGNYKTNDTVTFNQNPKIIDSIKCDFVKWQIENKAFKLSEVNLCKAKAKVRTHFTTEKIKLFKTDFGQVIKYYQDKKQIDKFRIIKFDLNSLKEFKLIRFDKISEQKLYKYIDSLIFNVLKYKPTFNENLTNESVKVNDGNQNIKIKIRDGESKNLEPLIVVNGYPINNKEILKELLFVETYGITYLTKEKSAMLYGYRAVNGVIIIETSEKKFRIVRKKYGW